MYTVKQTSLDCYEIASWGDYRAPLDVYHINKNRCDCPASFRSRSCKHLKLVESFKELESGAWAFEFVGTQVQPRHIPLLEVR